MARSLSLGTFSRGRRDWSIEELMVGSAQISNSNPQQSRFSLNNNTAVGRSLAVYGLLCYRSLQPYLWSADVLVGQKSGGLSNLRTLIPTRAALDGLISVENLAITAAAQPFGVVFVGDGREWLTLGDLPMFVIPAGSRLAVNPYQLVESGVSGENLSVTFLWGYYFESISTTSLLSSLRARVSQSLQPPPPGPAATPKSPGAATGT